MRAYTVFVLLFVLLWFAGTAAVGAAVFHRVAASGTIDLQVSDAMNEVGISLPVGLALLLLDSSEVSVGDARLRVRHDLQDWGPAVRAALEELEGYDDVPLLEVESNGEWVRVAKQGSRIVIEVDGGREQVKISMPHETLRTALRLIER